MSDAIPHGTRKGYREFKCRCEECRRWNRESHKAWRKDTERPECSRDDCTNGQVAHGLCSTHYNQTRPDRHKKAAVVCTYCAKQLLKYPSKRYRPFCDYTCRDLFLIENKQGVWGKGKKEPRPKPAPRDLRSPLRRAWEDGDHAGVLDAIKAHCDVRPSGCWEWQRRLDASGYATVQVGKRRVMVHRLSLEAKLGRELGKQPAHHACANTFCVNPDHLQPVTHAANAAEMLARRYMEQRIRDLEAALAAIAPSHPLLDEVGIPIAS